MVTQLLPLSRHFWHSRLMHSLPLFLRLAGRPVILIGDGDAAAAKRRLLERCGAQVVGEDAQAALAIVALDDDDAATAAVLRLKARGILANATDRPALCDFTLPAIVDRDPVLVAIGTGGASAGLAAALRQRLEAALPAGLGGVATALYSARAAIKARYPDAGKRRRALAEAMEKGGVLDVLADHPTHFMAQWLERAEPDTRASVSRVTLTSSDPDELTVRAARLLSSADCVCYTADVPAAILRRARADAVLLACTDPPQSCAHGLCVYLSFAS